MPKKLEQELLELNRKHSELFVGQAAARVRYHAEHKVNIAAFKCMDGRVNLSVLTKAPLGIIRPFRNIGGVFDLGWTALNSQIVRYVFDSAEKGRMNLFLATYHFSQGRKHRGCRGHNYDADRARACAAGLVEQIRRIFAGDTGIYPVMVGVETDSQSLIIHDGSGAESKRVSDLPDDEEAVREPVRRYFTDMPREIVNVLASLLAGNVRHVAEMRGARQEPEDLDHKERIIAVGQVFDWLHRPNLALIINDLESTLDDTIGKAAGIVKENRDAGRIPADRALFFASVPYEHAGHDRRAAVERARYLTRLGLDSIAKFHPDLKGFFKPLTAVIHWDTRGLEVIE